MLLSKFLKVITSLDKGGAHPDRRVFGATPIFEQILWSDIKLLET